ncbi:MAG: ferrous iron transport protein B [Lachnospiraceae bacterium]|nr:ferrous iron transport protein B [Lachnospiraceae bacterium]MBR3581210.1 ferrous iron transport protein B [Lachnospiraceae bacterium]MBR4541696.1 ferrous iron transport protein B [Lachnospiraceae bacterium]
MTLKDLKKGESAVITTVGGQGALRQHFLDMGVIPGAEVTLIKYAPMGDPMELTIHGYELTLRLADAEKIGIEAVQSVNVSDENKDEAVSDKGHKAEKNGKDAKDGKAIKSGKDDKAGKGEKASKELRKYREHPGFGEEGIYHDHTNENPLPEGTKLTFALAGNQNCGKTTLFNQLTGANQHVGNFPGVTVDRKSGAIKNNPSTEVVDLPGIYSLSPYTDEEIVSRQYILNEKPKGIINIVDATNIERNLYLTMQLIELDVPMVLAINMMDEMRSNGGAVRINDMEALLGIPVVPISASKNEGVDELIRHAVHVAKYQERPGKQDFCDENDNGGAVHRCIHGIMQLIDDHAKRAEIPVRFAANKIIEGDERVIAALDLSQNEKEMVEHIILQMEDERGMDRSAAMADMRFSFIKKLVAASVVKPKESKERQRSEKFDAFLTGKYTAIPAFIGIMGIIFWLTFNVIGAWLQDLLESGIGFLTDKMDACLESWKVNEVIRSLVIDGIFTGVGSVLSFLPIIILLFFFLSLLEDTGYMARVAFVMDKPLRKLGLSGRSIVPLLIGFGCSVPGVMAGRTLPSARDRKLTIMLIPFMSCTAKLPIYAFFTSLFFPGRGALIMVGLYLFGIIMGIITAYISKKTIFKGEAVPFVMELPNYRMPGLKNVARLLWDKAKDFLTRAFTVIFVATIVIWFLQSFSFSFSLVENSKDSMLAVISGFLAPLFVPLGFGDWRVATALITGFMAKESVVSTFSVLFGTSEAMLSAISPAAALSLLVFCLLYTPCVAAVASVKRELGRKWAAGIVVFQCSIAWITALVVKLVASMFI